MKLKLIRTSRQEGFTTGVLYAGDEMLAHTLEPQMRNLNTEPKVWGRTAIPPGTYRVVLSPSSRFKCKMPYLVDVPRFSGIMFHSGNRVADTKGCILVGERGGGGTLKNSRATFAKLYDLLEKADKAEEVITLTIH